mgnify:FL=1
MQPLYSGVGGEFFLYLNDCFSACTDTDLDGRRPDLRPDLHGFCVHGFVSSLSLGISNSDLPQSMNAWKRAFPANTRLKSDRRQLPRVLRHALRLPLGCPLLDCFGGGAF